MVGIIVVALLLTRVTGKDKPQVSEERAVEIARPLVQFTPEGHNIRLVRRGIPPHPFWAVSFWIKDRTGHATDVTVVLVDASTGRIDAVGDGT